MLRKHQIREKLLQLSLKQIIMIDIGFLKKMNLL